MDSLASLTRVLLRRGPLVPAGAYPLASDRGTLAIPIVMTALSGLEMAVVHFLVPWAALRIILLALSIAGVVVMFASIADRRVHPSYLHDDHLILRLGRRKIARVPLSQVRSAAPISDGSMVSPAIDGGILRLATQRGCTLALALTSAIEVRLRSSTAASAQQVSEIRLAVDDPTEVIAHLTLRPHGCPPTHS
jgi:hypothetical protein